MYYILWFFGLIAICMISVLVGINYEKKHGDEE